MSEFTQLQPIAEANNYGQKIHSLLHHLRDHQSSARRRVELLVYMFLIVIYFGILASLLGANFQPQSVIEETYFIPFHMLEFWGAFAFAVLEAFILVSIGVLDVEHHWYAALLVAINICATLVAAILFSFDPEAYEFISHLIEYSAQITLTAANFLFIFLLPRQPTSTLVQTWKRFRIVEIVVVACFMVVAILKFLVYLSVIVTDMEPERAAHFFEFTGEMANAVFAFVFAFLLYADFRAVEHAHDHQMKLEE